MLAPMESNVIPLPHQIYALSRAISGDRVRYLLTDEVDLDRRSVCKDRSMDNIIRFHIGSDFGGFKEYAADKNTVVCKCIVVFS